MAKVKKAKKYKFTDYDLDDKMKILPVRYQLMVRYGDYLSLAGYVWGTASTHKNKKLADKALAKEKKSHSRLSKIVKGNRLM